MANTENPDASEQEGFGARAKKAIKGKVRHWGQNLRDWAAEKTMLNSPADSPDHKKLEAFITTYGESKQPISFKSTEAAFDEYLRNRVSNLNLFSKVNGPNGVALSKHFKDDPVFKDAISNALQLDAEMDTKKTAFDEEIKELKEDLKDPAINYTAHQALGHLFNLRDEATKAIKAQHQREEEKLHAKLDSEDFKTHLKNSLDYGDDPQPLEQLVTNMKTALKTKQADELKNFEKSMNQDLEKSLQMANKRALEVAFLAELYHLNQNNQNMFSKLAKNSDAPINIVVGSMAKGASSNYFNDIKLSSIEKFETASGAIIQQVDGGFHLGLRNNRDSAGNQKDIRLLVNAVKAAGGKSIILKVDLTDEKKAMEMARKCYQEAEAAGFPANKIKVQWLQNEDKKSPYLAVDQLFSGATERQQHAAKIGADRKKTEERSLASINGNPKKQQDFKNDLLVGREARKEKRARAEEEARQAAAARPTAH